MKKALQCMGTDTVLGILDVPQVVQGLPELMEIQMGFSLILVIQVVAEQMVAEAVEVINTNSQKSTTIERNVCPGYCNETLRQYPE